MDMSSIDLTFVPELLRLPYSQVWSDYDYDEGADVLYLSFEKPQCANDTQSRARRHPLNTPIVCG